MKTIAVVVWRDKFTEEYISSLETNFSREYDFVFFTNRREQYPLYEHKSKLVVLNHSREVFKEPYIDILLDSDVVIISGFFFNPPKHIKEEKKLFEKLWIQFWGGDYTCFRPYHLRNGVYIYLERYKRRIKFIRNCRGWITLMKGENKEISKWSLKRKETLVAPVMIPHDAEENETYIIKEVCEEGPLRIILGNSAARENDHISILKRLAHLRKENIQILCPLSYGDAKNAEKVKLVGEKIMGEKFIPLLSFVPKEEYLNMLKSVDVAIYNNNRQQAIGNIEEMLRQGKKVYLRKTTPMWKWYAERGEKIYSTKSLRFLTMEELAFFPKEFAEANVEIDREIRRTKWALNQWEKVLEIVTNA